MDVTLGPISLRAAVEKLMLMKRNQPWREAWAAVDKIIWKLDNNIAEYGPESFDVCGKVHDVAGYTHTIQTSTAADGTPLNFTLVTILDAGHMAPGNQPLSVKDMVERFIEGRTFHL